MSPYNSRRALNSLDKRINRHLRMETMRVSTNDVNEFSIDARRNPLSPRSDNLLLFSLKSIIVIDFCALHPHRCDTDTSGRSRKTKAEHKSPDEVKKIIGARGWRVARINVIIPLALGAPGGSWDF